MATPVKIGYDIGVDIVKIAVDQGGSFRTYERRLPENLMEGEIISSPNAFSVFLREVKDDFKIPAGPAGLVLPSGQALCRFVTMPKVTEDQLLINLPYEFNDYFTDSKADYFFDYALCTPNPEEIASDEMPMMAAVAPKRLLATWEEIFSRAGIHLKAVLPPEMATLALAKKSPDPYTCFVDLGQRQTRVTIIHGDRIPVSRLLPLGCQDIDQAIANHFGVDPYLASTYKEANFQDALDLPECQAIYGSIGVELLKVFNFYQYTYRDNTLRGVYLVGGGSAIAPLTAAIAEALGAEGLPVEEILPPSTGASAFVAPTFFNAVGMVQGGA